MPKLVQIFKKFIDKYHDYDQADILKGLTSSLSTLQSSDYLATVINQVDSEGNTLLHLAVLNGHTDVVNFILTEYESLNVNKANHAGATALHLLAMLPMSEKPNIANIKTLINCLRVNVNAIVSSNNKKEEYENFSVLQIACNRGHMELIDLLIPCEELDVNYTTPEGNAACSIALENEDVEINFEKIVRHSKFDVTQLYADGNTLLHLIFAADRSIDIPLLEYLVQNQKTQINHKNLHGDAPIHTVTTDGSSTFLEVLLTSNTIDVNAQDKQGNTPAHLAVSFGDLEQVELLLNDARTDVNIQNENHQTPKQLLYDLGNRVEIKTLYENWENSNHPSKKRKLN